MSDQALGRLRLLGTVVLSICLVLLAVHPLGGPEVQLTDALAGFAAIGVGLLLLAEIGPFVKALRAGGLEIDFVETLGDRFGALEQRVAQLELVQPPPGSIARQVLLPAPALKRDVTVRDDPNKGRFGGQASAGGFTLRATFRSVTPNCIDILLEVEADAGVTLGPHDRAEIFLHDSFHPDHVDAPFNGRVAELSRLSYGGFTAGVWIPSHQVELELDLSRLRSAPRAIREN